MENNDQEDMFPSEIPDRTWLPAVLPQYDLDSTTLNFEVPLLHDSNGCLSTGGSNTADYQDSLPHGAPVMPLPTSYAAFELPQVFHDDFVHDSHYIEPVYYDQFNQQVWNCASLPDPLPQFQYDASKADGIEQACPIQDMDDFPRHDNPSHRNSLPTVMLGDQNQWSLAPYSHTEDFNLAALPSVLTSGHDASWFTSDQISEMCTMATPSYPLPVTTVGDFKQTQKPVSKPIRPAQRKAGRKSQNTRRSGPLDDHTRKKADEMRDIGACWRCRKYKKPCNDTTGVCKSCQVPGFRVWPSTLGCRRERLESLVLFLLPAHMEQKLQFLPQNYAKTQTWRVLAPFPLPAKVEDSDCVEDDQWAVSIREARSAWLFDIDYAELANIARTYQSTRAKPIRALEASCTLLIATLKLYQCFIRTPGCTQRLTVAEIVKQATVVRLALKKSFVLIQQLCLSTKRTDWFPAFLSACLATCAGVVYVDCAIAVPSPVREMIWGDFHETRAGLRQGGYQMLVDLQRASTNGINPMRQDCWSASSSSKIEEMQRVNDRYSLLGADTAAMEGLVALKAWQEKYKPTLDEGRAMFAANAYQLARLRPMAGLSKMFDF